MKIAYITVKLPYGKQETFIIPEIAEVLRQGEEVIILPFRPGKEEIYNREAQSFMDITHRSGTVTFPLIYGAFKEFARNIIRGLKIIVHVIIHSRSGKIALKNISAIPKGFYAARLFKLEKVQHIHAHWASRTATVAYIASYLSDIPWSFTAHRWDIAENNLLAEKVESASFARLINEKGKQEVIEKISNEKNNRKVRVIHLGVNIPDNITIRKPNQSPPFIVCPANMVTKKGHIYLIEACKILIKRNIVFKCILAGDGPLEPELRSMVYNSGLTDHIDFAGRLPQEKLIEMYKNNIISAVVLPSIVTRDGEAEGIPVALMEAMANGVPVVTTDTGGIPELVDNSCGYVVQAKNPDVLANAIIDLFDDETKRNKIILNAYEKVRKDFSQKVNASILINMIHNSSMCS